MMSLEKTLTIADPANPRATLTRADHATLARLALKTADAIAVTSKHKVTSYSLQEDFIVLVVRPPDQTTGKAAIPSLKDTEIERMTQAKPDPTERWARPACAAV
jgi:nucleotide-binding universal stress UspA family protein